MNKTYAKPVINRLEGGLMNKYGRQLSYSQNTCQTIEGLSVKDLAAKYGSPLYVFSEREIRRRVREVRRAFDSRYPNIAFAWSYKTNYLGAVCSVMHQEGSLAEVVSDMEYEKARSLGVPGSAIIFNGPFKPYKALKKACEEGTLVNIDHLDELTDLESIANELDKTVEIGLRMNLDSGIQPQWSRFGFNLETGQAMEAVRRMAAGGKLCLTALHCHIGTYILNPQAYSQQIAKLIKFAYEVEKEFGFNIEILDIGGGLPSQNRLKGTYMPADVAVPSIDEYAEAICDALYLNLKPGHMPKVILESGRSLIDSAGKMITSVVAGKRLPDGTRAYVIDAGLNLLFTAFWYKFKVQLARKIPGINENSVLYGPLCMNIDVVDESIMLPPLERGDHLVIGPVGAYTVTQSMQFIHYRPNIVMIDENRNVQIIRVGDDLSNITQNEYIPDRLTQLPEMGL
ncbi:MAG: diaminopimelate decarboxylase [Planctomycetota bacterium]|jgi:diaminopimelate decarboxylase